MGPHILQGNPSIDDDAWQFTVPQSAMAVSQRMGSIRGKLIIFTSQAITLQVDQFPMNRILNSDDPSKFILLSFGGLRFPDSGLRATADYINRLMKAGLFLNGVQYRFYHHSNSQLRGRSCFFREANTDSELDQRIYQLGDFAKIMNVAKRAKRIGLLFSAAEIDFILDPKYITDIPDIKSGDEIFSDGCGLISKTFAIQLSRAKKIIFRGCRYTPTVFQIRYRGYKGVLSLHPLLDVEKKHLAVFRKSMNKFTITSDNTFSVVNYSKPYSFGRLNNDIVVLLSSLGITTEKLLSKQEEYFQLVSAASNDPVKAFDFLASIGDFAYELAEKVLLDGLDNHDIAQKIRKHQMSEIARFRSDRDKFKTRTIVHKSRRLFGICDPFQVLREGEVHIRITASRKGPSTPIHGDVLVVRNPCLHPGDCLKLRAVHNDKLSHLVDCIAFASVARPGHHAAPSMSSGGDLDGDEYFVCWDPDLVPSRVFESYDYPGNKERINRNISRADMANHFATYNASGLARVSALHAKWARASPLGAMSPECQELNALHSQSVDGASIKIPDRLTRPPEATQPFIIDVLAEAASRFSIEFLQRSPSEYIVTADADVGKKLLTQLLSEQHILSEYELFNLAHRLARKYNLDLRLYLHHIDMSALTAQQKYAIRASFDMSAQDHPEFWNSLIRSDILTPQDLYQRALGYPFSIQRLYSSQEQGLGTFFEFLHMATQQYTRKLLILQTGTRFSVGIFMRGSIPWDEDPEVNENVVVCSFMPHTSSAAMATHRPCTPGYRLHCSDSKFELYNKHRGDTFIFLNKPPRELKTEVAASIALQKISTTVQRQLGRINRTPVKNIELHVVSNHDRVAHQLFDLWFEHNPTEEYVHRLQHKAVPYRYNDLGDVNWEEHPDWLRAAFFPPRSDGKSSKNTRLPKHTADSMSAYLMDKMESQILQIFDFGLEHHALDEVFLAFDFLLTRNPLDSNSISHWLEKYPPLVFALLKVFPTDMDLKLDPSLSSIAHEIIRSAIRSANELGIASLVALEKMAGSISALSLEQYFDLLMLTALSVRAQQLVQEVLLVLNDSRQSRCEETPALAYGHKHALGIAVDRAEEAADECPCNEDGRPRRQRTAPTHVTLKFVEGEKNQVKAAVRIDARTSVRLHSHVRLQAASRAENRWIDVPVLDGIVVQAVKGELNIELQQPAPAELERMDWNMYNAGSIATSKAMMDALIRLLKEKSDSCGFYSIITGDETNFRTIPSPPEAMGLSLDHLNDSQKAAVDSWRSPLSLIWGPPGTGKTTVVVQILRTIIHSHDQPPKILMTASTHNAVDNVLERFIEINKSEHLLREEQILRVATDQTKVNPALQDYTIDSRVGGDINENSRLVKKAQERVNSAIIVFTTCAGAGLGVLRKGDFDIAIIDEASQITEPCALIPMVKGVKRGIMVGDHVQLRPTVRRMGKALEYDISLLERLYTHAGTRNKPAKTMLDVQYRSPERLNAFPSKEFYEGRLKTSSRNSDTVLDVLKSSAFPWPTFGESQSVDPTVFVQCSTEEEMGGMSKSNLGQVDMVVQILKLLKPKLPDGEEPRRSDTHPSSGHDLTITVLSPYTKQIQELRHRVPSPVTCSTIDSFQGRESDIVIFSAVRCNVEGDVGFLDDPRRLNVMWTRARLALVIVGDRRTMNGNALWKRALDSCKEVILETGTS